MNAIPVLAAVVLCLALAWVVSWDLAPLIVKPRARGTAAAVRPALEHRGVPITDPASVRAKVAALIDSGRLTQTQPQPALAEPVVPRYFQAWERGEWAP